MTESKERRYLQSVLKMIVKGPALALRSRLVGFLLWLATVALLVALLQWGSRAPFSVVIVASFFMGMLFGCYGLLHISARNWPWLSPHISRDSIEKRIHELQA